MLYTVKHDMSEPISRNRSYAGMVELPIMLTSPGQRGIAFSALSIFHNFPISFKKSIQEQFEAVMKIII